MSVIAPHAFYTRVIIAEREKSFIPFTGIDAHQGRINTVSGISTFF